jgi:hypothetical protein
MRRRQGRRMRNATIHKSTIKFNQSPKYTQSISLVTLLHLFSKTQPPTSPKSITEITAFPHPVTSTAHHNHTHSNTAKRSTPLSPVSPTYTHSTYIILTPPLRSPHPSPSPQQSHKSPHLPSCRASGAESGENTNRRTHVRR